MAKDRPLPPRRPAGDVPWPVAPAGRRPRHPSPPGGALWREVAREQSPPEGEGAHPVEGAPEGGAGRGERPARGSAVHADALEAFVDLVAERPGAASVPAASAGRGSAAPGGGVVEEEPEAAAMAAYAGEGWEGFEGEAPEGAPWEFDIDTDLVERAEMTGIWLTTQVGVSSPVWIDGEPIEPEDLGVGADVADRLRDWAQLWSDEWDAARGWRPRARIGDYEALGAWLARRVKDAVGAVEVTVQPAHLGRSGVVVVPALEQREPIEVVLCRRPRGVLPVAGEFVTASGVGSFSSELNGRLEAWGRRAAACGPGDPGWGALQREAVDLVEDMSGELGPDYRVSVEADHE